MIPLPAFIDPEAWAEFCDSRKRKKKPLTPGAETRLLKRCYILKEAGHDVNEALLQAADNYWLTVYEPQKLEVTRLNNAQVDSTQQYLQEQAEHARQVESQRQGREPIKLVRRV